MVTSTACIETTSDRNDITPSAYFKVHYLGFMGDLFSEMNYIIHKYAVISV